MTFKGALEAMGLDLERSMKRMTGLGNGGFWTAADGLLDSLATLGLPGLGMAFATITACLSRSVSTGGKRISSYWLGVAANPWGVQATIRL